LVRLLTNNPEKMRGLREAGITVERMEPLQTAAHGATWVTCAWCAVAGPAPD
jgi:GTP cyclohydrolase II